MSTWRDTIMSDEQIALVVYGEASEYSMRGGFFRDNKVASTQAEISFKMGYEEALKDYYEELKKQWAWLEKRNGG